MVIHGKGNAGGCLADDSRLRQLASEGRRGREVLVLVHFCVLSLYLLRIIRTFFLANLDE